MALVRRLRLIAAICAINGATGCIGPRPEARTASAENLKMDCLTRCGEELARKDRPPSVVRSQAPEVLPPVKLTSTPGRSTVGDPPTNVGRTTVGGAEPIAPPIVAPGRTVVTEPVPGIIVPASAANPPGIVAPPPVSAAKPVPAAPAAPAMEGDTQVRIVATIGKTPIYESEVREAVYNRLPELNKIPDSQRAAKEKEMFREELKRIIERELVLDEMTARLTALKQTAMLAKVRESTMKDAEQRVREIKKELGVPSDEIFRDVLRSRGLTYDGLKRQFARGMMVQSYLRQTAAQKMDAVSLIDVREYYASHKEEFQAEEKVVWLDLFVMTNRFRNPAEARQYAENLMVRARRGEDFVKLVNEYGMGDSKLRNGAGIGEKPGEIFPQEVEPTLLAMKTGDVTLKETETGTHVLKVTERVKAGARPLDEKLQGDIRRKIQNQVFERESKRLIDTLWKRSQPQIWIEL